jgi:hypothetical protein
LKPKIIIEKEVYQKIMHWVNKSEYEVSGFGTVQVEKDGVVRVTSAMLLPQKNGATHTDIEADAICKALFELRDAPGELKWWWHSHVKMGVFWSGTDHQAMRDFASTDDSWMVCTVFNQLNQRKSAYYAPASISTPWGYSHLFLDDLETQVNDLIDQEKVKQWDEEYAKNVQNNRPVASRFWDAQAQDWVEINQAGNEKKLSKRERKKIKKQEEAQEQSIFDEFGLDELGFDREERALLAQARWAKPQIEDMLDRDFTGLQILMIAEAGFDYVDIIGLLDENQYTNLDVMRNVRVVLDSLEQKDLSISDDAPTIGEGYMS